MHNFFKLEVEIMLPLAGSWTFKLKLKGALVVWPDSETSVFKLNLFKLVSLMNAAGGS